MYSEGRILNYEIHDSWDGSDTSLRIRAFLLIIENALQRGEHGNSCEEDLSVYEKSLILEIFLENVLLSVLCDD